MGELRFEQVRQVRGGRQTLEIEDLTIRAGEHVSVLGPNGAGKTTLLRLVAGVDLPASGTLTLDGVSTSRGGVELRRRVAYATQRPGLLSTSVRRNIDLPLRWRKVPRGTRATRTAAALERLRITHLADRPARMLSGGEQQRVNLARALALDPEVLLLDEPAAGLDAQTRSAFFTDLEDALADRATTVLQVSHRADEAFRFADRVVVLGDGHVHQVGTPDELNLRPADAQVAALVGYDNLVDATVQPDGAVLVGGAPTGLVQRPTTGSRTETGRATVAVFAAGVRLADSDEVGLPVRVTRVSVGAGHRELTLVGAGPLVAHLAVGLEAPSPGDEVRVVFDPALSAVLPPSAPPGDPARVAAPGLSVPWNAARGAATASG